MPARNPRTSPDAAHPRATPGRVVVKLGTNLITGGRNTVDEAAMTEIVAQIAGVRAAGAEVLIVTSGAVAAGRDALSRTAHPERLHPRTIAYKQALAALGQAQLMLTYERLFGAHNLEVAQALISRGDLHNRLGYLNIRNTLDALLEIGAVPIINENDVVAVEELAGEVYGDNDRLSAMVANAVDADLLILLGEMDGLYTADPHLDPKAQIIAEVAEITPEIEAAAGGPRDGRGSGGMASKLDAARLAIASGTDVVIASGHAERVISRLCAGEQLGTTFRSRVSRVEGRKRWIFTGFTEHRGGVAVDAGAVTALRERGNSLLPAGIVAVEGAFERGDIIGVKGPDGRVIAWGLANYASTDVQIIKGRNSKDLPSLLGHYYGTEVVHRNNMALA